MKITLSLKHMCFVLVLSITTLVLGCGPYNDRVHDSYTAEESKAVGSFIDFYKVTGNMKQIVPPIKHAWVEHVYFRKSMFDSEIHFYDTLYNVVVSFYEKVDRDKYHFRLFDRSPKRSYGLIFGECDNDRAAQNHYGHGVGEGGIPDSLVIVISSRNEVKYIPADTLWLKRY